MNAYINLKLIVYLTMCLLLLYLVKSFCYADRIRQFANDDFANPTFVKKFSI